MSKVTQQAELEFISVKNDSEPNKEVVFLNVLKAGNTSGFAIVDSTFDAHDEPSNEFRHIFLFPRIEVKAGEVIAVVTGTGTYSGKATQLSTTSTRLVHKLFWNSKAAVWNDKEGDTARLIRYSVVDKSVVPATKKQGIKTKG